MFEPLINGTVEKIIKSAKKYNVNYGIGGIGRIGSGDLPAEKILTEYYRLGSNKAILSRSFYNTKLNLFDKEIYSSSQAREKILSGDVGGANKILGYPFFKFSSVLNTAVLLSYA